MNNFLDFINNDVEVKKTLLSSLPVKTKTNIKKFNDTIDEFTKKYTAYKDSVYKYINAKNKSIKVKESNKNNDKYKKRISKLQEVRSFFNPYNTYYEKMGFDELVYRISNYYVFNFDSVDKIINEFIDKFELVGIELKKSDFNYTCYVNKYMETFLEVRKGNSNLDNLNRIFEEIYWINPDLISHIELNFRKLIKNNSKKFEDYIKRKQKELSKEYSVDNYRDVIKALESAYDEYNAACEEDVSDIVTSAINGEFDISQYLESSKFRQSAYISFISPSIDTNDKANMDKICVTLDKLSENLKEYSEYLQISPMIEQFKADYEKLATQNEVNYNEMKSVDIVIKKKEAELEKLNKKIARKSDNRALKVESISQAKKLYVLYKKYDDEYIKSKVLSVLNINMTISEVLDLFYSFDYYKKNTIQKVFELKSYNDVIEKGNIFNDFAMNPTNIISKGLPVFEEVNIPRIIANKYKLNNIQINEEDITEDNISILNSKILLIDRINKINNSDITVEKIWFLVKSKKILNPEG